MNNADQPLQRFGGSEGLYDSREFLDALAEGVMLIGLDGVILDANDTAMRLLGVTRTEMIGRQLTDPLWGVVDESGAVISPQDLPSSITLHTGKSVVDRIIGFDIPGDGRRWMSTNSCAIGTGGNMKGVTNTFLDVTYLMAEKRALRTFMELAKLNHPAMSESSLLFELCGDIVTLGGYALAWIGSVSRTTETFEILASAGDIGYLSEGLGAGKAALPNGSDIALSALGTDAVVVVTNFSSTSDSAPWQKSARKRGFGAAIAIPIAKMNDDVAILTIFGREAGAFDQKSEDLLTQMTTAFSLSLRRMSDANDLVRAYEGTLLALGTMVESRDPYTAGHQANVGRLAFAIAGQLGLPLDECHLIRQAGEVHDVGKYCVPAEILARSGKLDPAEFELIKRHPIAGAEVLRVANLPTVLIDVAHQHHERLDGSGYPLGLSGDQLSLPARIVAVADVVEAMAHLRPYRGALGLDAALQTINAGSGVTFDASVVAACVTVMEGGFTFSTGPETSVVTVSV